MEDTESLHPAQDSANKPWFKQFWPWFLITFPAIAVIAGIITIIIAVKSDDGLVNDDYYKSGLAINQTIERKQKAAELELNAHASWDSLTQSVTLKLTGNLTKLPQRLKLKLTHPTRSNLDQTVSLFLGPDKKAYTGRTKSIKKGNWIIDLEPENLNWRINGRASLPEQAIWKMNSE